MAIKITQYHPIDLAGVKDDGIKSLVLLAASLGFKYDWRSGKPIILFAADQTQINLSTETSINAGVFQGKLNNIMTHYDAHNYTPTIELIDAIIKQCKPNRDQQRMLRLAVGETVEQTRKRIAAQEAGPATEKRNPDEHLTQRIIVHDFNETPPEPDPLVVHLQQAPEPPYTLKPHRVSFGAKDEDGVPYYTYDSDSIYDRIWVDGHIDYICRFCHDHGRPDYVVAGPTHIGTHWATHVREDGVPKATNRDKVLYRRDGKPAGINAALRKANAERLARGELVRKPRVGTKAYREAEREAERAAAMAETIADVVEESKEEARELLNRTPTIEDVKAAIAPLNDAQKIWAIRNIIDDGQVEKLQAENTRLANRVASLESDLRALKDLIGGIK